MAHQGNGTVAPDDPVASRAKTRVFLQPFAAPSILGSLGYAGATFMVAANMAGWSSNTASDVYVFPFAADDVGVAAGRVSVPLRQISEPAKLPGGHEHIPLQFEMGGPAVRCKQ